MAFTLTKKLMQSHLLWPGSGSGPRVRIRIRPKRSRSDRIRICNTALYTHCSDVSSLFLHIYPEPVQCPSTCNPRVSLAHLIRENVSRGIITLIKLSDKKKIYIGPTHRCQDNYFPRISLVLFLHTRFAPILG
jgi:hypothetical protein